MIQDTLSKVVYVANGEQREWDVPFQFYDSKDLHIYLTDDGVRVEEVFQNFEVVENGVKKEVDNPDIDFNKEGNYVIYPTPESGLAPLEAGKQILILRETPNTQEEDSSEIYFKSKDIERGLDKLTMQVQELARDSYRAVKVSHFDTTSPEDFTEMLFEASAKAEEAAARAAASESNAALSEQNAASSKLSAEQASASAAASAELAQNASDTSLQNAERAEQAAAGSAASAVSSAESASLAQDLLNQVGESIYSKPEIDAKISGLQAEIDNVESYIPLGTNSNNTLINKQQLLDEEMDMREDLNEGLSELQTQITAQASAIAKKQDKLVAGANITIDGNVISATGGGGGGTGVDVEPATEEKAGIISISTSEEAREGFDDTTAMTPLKTAQAIYDNVGRAIQLGFDGTLSGNVLTFEPDTDTAYELKTGYNYTIDLLFPAVVADGTLDENISMVINNNGESIKIVNALNDDVDTDITVGNMKQIMKYTTDIGFRWIFNASLANTTDGRKVFVMPSTVVNVQGGGSVPEGVYTRESLLGGKDIEIVPEPVEGGIDENTLACWHFDDKTTDEISGIDANPNGGIAYEGKFGGGSGNGKWGLETLPFSVSSDMDFSFDYWLYRPYDSWSSHVGFITPNGYNAIFNVYCFGGGGQVGVGVMKSGTSAMNTSAVIKPGIWDHIYCHYKKEIRTFATAVNGKFVFSEVNASDFSNVNQWCVTGSCYVDELRISKCVRWEEDFTPPTQPYRKAEPTGNYVVNFTGEAGGSNGDYVVERYDDSEGNWYEIWKSERLRQGGLAVSETSGIQTVTFLKPFTKAPHITGASLSSDEGAGTNRGAAIVYSSNSVTSTGFTMYLAASIKKYWTAEGQMQASDGKPPLSEDLYLVGDFNNWEKQDSYKFVWDAQQNLYTITNVTVPNSWMKISSTNNVYIYGPVEDGKVMGSGDTINVKGTTGNWNFNETTQNLNVKFSLANMTVYIGAS